jgi:hypothetical protein
MEYIPGTPGHAIPRFFNAELKGGILTIPKTTEGKD